jgi:glutamyl-tRNA reductase
VAEEVTLFEEWMASMSVVPTLVALREWATSVKEEELQKHLAKMPDLTEEERNKVGSLAHALVNKFLHPPTVRMKDMAGNEEGYRHAESLRALFGLDSFIPGSRSEGTGRPAHLVIASPAPPDAPETPPGGDGIPAEHMPVDKAAGGEGTPGHPGGEGPPAAQQESADQASPRGSHG